MSGHSTWRIAREKVLRATARGEAHRVAEGDEHIYLSTSCLHGEHHYCANIGGVAGPKEPACCKFCKAPCICDCHSEGSPQDRRLAAE